jgi:hypothetical protein
MRSTRILAGDFKRRSRVLNNPFTISFLKTKSYQPGNDINIYNAYEETFGEILQILVLKITYFERNDIYIYIFFFFGL